MLELDTNKVCFIIVKARELETQADVIEPIYEADAEEDSLHHVKAAYGDDATFAEIHEIIDDMNIDEQCQLVALTWVGRGDFSADEWGDALSAARGGHNKHTATYLLGTPLLPDYLEEGLAAFDLSCDGF